MDRSPHHGQSVPRSGNSRGTARYRHSGICQNPMVPDPELWSGAIERFARCGLDCICAVHRGFHFYGENLYRNPPFWQIPVELRRRFPGLPLFCDPSHITGRRDLVEDIARQALILGFDGLMIEVHPDPDRALSDAAQQITPEDLACILGRLKIRKTSTQDAEAAAAIDDLRTGIDRIDAALIDLLAQRMDISASIGLIKERSGMTVLQADRWNNVLERARAMAKEKTSMKISSPRSLRLSTAPRWSGSLKSDFYLSL